MKVEFAMEYIPRRMKELGYGNNYQIRWRHFQLDGNDTLEIDSDNHYYLLIDPSSSFKVESKLGFFDLTDSAINEMQYEHRGKLKIKNNSKAPDLILFIQIIPYHIKQF